MCRGFRAKSTLHILINDLVIINNDNVGIIIAGWIMVITSSRFFIVFWGVNGIIRIIYIIIITMGDVIFGLLLPDGMTREK
jgi:hypothetical protein